MMRQPMPSGSKPSIRKGKAQHVARHRQERTAVPGRFDIFPGAVTSHRLRALVAASSTQSVAKPVVHSDEAAIPCLEFHEFGGTPLLVRAEQCVWASRDDRVDDQPELINGAGFETIYRTLFPQYRAKVKFHVDANKL